VKKIAIIGAGLSGLSVASLLKDNANITVFEKARGVGGRMSTRRADPYSFDHGAQYFTARTKNFQNFIKPLIDVDVIKPWNARYVKFDGNQIIDVKNSTDEKRYVGVPGMNAFAKHLAINLNVNINTKIVSLKKDTKWNLYDDKGNVFDNFDWVISTAPSPQTKDILPKEFKYYDEIKSSEMKACFSLMLGFSYPLPMKFDSAHVINSDVNWIAVNSAKPSRSNNYSLMVHSSAEYAEKYIDHDRGKVINHLCSVVSNIIGYDVSKADHASMHGWRYASNSKNEKLPVLIDYDLQVASCGDWCEGGRVEGAFTSAQKLSEKLKKIL
jgi:renalase